MVVILSGDQYRVEARYRILKADFLEANDALALEELDLELRPELMPADVLGALANVSLFNPRKMVILKRLSSRSDFQEKIEDICAAANQDASLLIIEPKLDTRGRFGKYLKGQPGHEEHAAYKGRDLEDWLIAQADAAGSRLERPLAAYLIEKAGSDCLLLEKEIAKLCLHPEISRDLIDELVATTPSSQTFDFLDALMRGELGRALDFYQDQRRQKTDPMLILGLLVWQLRILVVFLGGKFSQAELAQEFGLKPFVVQKARNLSRSISSQHLLELIRLCRRTDQRIRSEFINPDEALLFLIFKACQLKS